MDRRDFLRTSALATLGFVVACGKNVPVTKAGTLDAIQGRRAQALRMDWSSVEVLSRPGEHLTFTLSDPKGTTPVAGATGNIWIAKDQTTTDLYGPFPIRALGDGFEQVGLYLAKVDVPADGVYIAMVDARTPDGDAGKIGQAQIVVGSSNAQIKPGARALATVTPTRKNHHGVEPYCTAKPPCGMHELSLDRALASGKPTVAIIATPAFCESRLCGPEVELLGSVARATGDAVNFVHIEVYRNDDADTIRQRILSPAAAAWKLEIEPATYWIDAKGKIVDRALGPLDGQGFRDATRALLG